MIGSKVNYEYVSTCAAVHIIGTLTTVDGVVTCPRYNAVYIAATCNYIGVTRSRDGEGLTSTLLVAKVKCNPSRSNRHVDCVNRSEICICCIVKRRRRRVDGKGCRRCIVINDRISVIAIDSTAHNWIFFVVYNRCYKILIRGLYLSAICGSCLHNKRGLAVLEGLFPKIKRSSNWNSY